MNNEAQLADLKKAYLAAKRLAENPRTSESARRSAESFAQKIAAEIADLEWSEKEKSE